MGCIGAHTILHLAVLKGVVCLRDINPMRMEALTAAIGVVPVIIVEMAEALSGLT